MSSPARPGSRAFSQARGVDRIFGLQGGHIQPIWDHVARRGIRIIDVRRRRRRGSHGARPCRAHRPARRRHGDGRAGRDQHGHRHGQCLAGARAGAADRRLHVAPAGQYGPAAGHPACRHPAAGHPRGAHRPRRRAGGARARRSGRARDGRHGRARPGLCRDPDRRSAHVGARRNWCSTSGCRPKPARLLLPEPAAVAQAVDVFWSARRPLVITGRGARQAGAALVRLLDASGAVYLDTQESRGLVPADHPAFVGAVRAAAMTEADVVLLIGRKLDYQLGYGSPAVFPNARFIRIADTPGELIDNRRGQPELLADPALALAAMVEAAGNRESSLDKAWADGLRRRHRERMTAGASREQRAGGRRRRQDPSARHLRRHRGGRRSRLHRRLPTAAIS